MSRGAGQSGALRARAEQAGIQTAYRPSGARSLRRVPDATLRALLDVLGPASSLPRPSRGGRVRCVDPRELYGRRRAYGLWLNLYALRSDRGFGVGHLGDLRAVVRWAGERGAAFVGVNPLHDLRNREPDVSPYQPLSRLFRNPLYLDPTATPEWAEAPAAQRAFASQRRRRLLDADRIDYTAASSLHEEVVAHLHRAFRRIHRERDTARARAFERFRREGGERLRQYARYRTRDARGPARALAEERLLWSQFELDRQLAGVAREARRAGLRLGLYQDLALGTGTDGFDPEAVPTAFARGVSLGAPPDGFNPAGQDWGLPPLHPARLADEDFGYWRSLLRAALRHAGMLRVDHILGCLRQWWIPAGRPASEGGYVRFPASALLRVLAEESRRAGAVVVGEDLGTVPPGLASLLARYGVLSSRVLLFEREPGGRFKPPARYSSRALATANTHDLPPLAGWWSGRDLALRRELGLLEGPRALARARRERDADRAALLRRLRASGGLRGGGEPRWPEVAGAVHRMLCATPAPLVGLSFDDLAGEAEPVNLPGLPQSRFRSWSRRMERSLDAILRDPDVEHAVAGAAARRL